MNVLLEQKHIRTNIGNFGLTAIRAILVLCGVFLVVAQLVKMKPLPVKDIGAVDQTKLIQHSKPVSTNEFYYKVGPVASVSSPEFFYKLYYGMDGL